MRANCPIDRTGRVPRSFVAATLAIASWLLAETPLAAADQPADPVAYTPGGGLTFGTKSGDLAFRAGGILTFDAGVFDGGRPEIEADRQVRDVLGILSGRILKDLRFQVVHDFSAEEVGSFKNVVATYEGTAPLAFTFGNIKVPFSLQHLQALPQVTFHERALPFALAPRRRVGLSIGVTGDRWQAAGGAYGTNLNDEVRFDDRAYALRATYAPKLSGNDILHLGAAVNFVEPEPETATFGFPPETLLPGRPLVASGPLRGTDHFWRGNLELAGLFGPVTLQSEYHRVVIDGAGGADPTFQGGYVQASWLLTGERRPYIVHKDHMLRGVIGRPKPSSAVHFRDFAAGGIGAWEIAARLSAVDLRDNGVGQGSERNLSLALQWFPNATLRASVNYVHGETDEPERPNEKVNAGLFRLQFLL